LAQAEVKIEELWATVTTANEAAKRATAAEAATQIAAQAAAQEKTALQLKVAGLEQDLATFGADLRTANKQFSEVANKLQDATDEATWLRNANSKLAQDIEGEQAPNGVVGFFFSLIFVNVGLLPCGHRALCTSHHDDREAHRIIAGRERHQAQDPREGQLDQAAVGAARE
jgi:seryl-tRNA synthetase